MDADPPAPESSWLCPACGCGVAVNGSGRSRTAGETTCPGCGRPLSCLVLNQRGPKVVKVLGPTWELAAWDEIERIGANPDEPWLVVDMSEVESFSEHVYLRLILAKAQRFLASSSPRWRLRGPSAEIQELFRNLKLDQVFELD